MPIVPDDTAFSGTRPAPVLLLESETAILQHPLLTYIFLLIPRHGSGKGFQLVGKLLCGKFELSTQEGIPDPNDSIRLTLLINYVRSITN